MTRFSSIVLALLAAAFLAAGSACTVANGNRSTGQWSYASVGGDFDGMLDPDGMIGKVDNSTSFSKAADVTGKVIGYIELSKAVRSVAGDARKAYEANRDLRLDQAKVNSRETIRLREIEAAEAAAAAEAEAAASLPIATGEVAP